MPVAIRAATRIQDMDDINVSLGVGVDEYALTWDNDTAKFVLRQVAGVYLLATGATVGATAQAQAFTNGIVGPSWKPSADSTTALQLQNASGTSVLNVDTTNGRVGIGTTGQSQRFVVKGSSFLYDGVASFGMHGLYDGVNPDYSPYIQVGEDNTWTGYFSANANFDGTHYNFLYPGNYQAATRIALLPGGIIAFDVGIGTSNPITWNRSVTILNSGYVGIGTDSPATRLDIDAGALTMAEMTAPTGAANKATLYTKDNGSGKTALCVKLGDDVEIVLATQA